MRSSRRWPRVAALPVVVVTALVLSGCVASASSSTLVGDCSAPVAPFEFPDGAGALPLAETVRESDSSTSIVLDADDSPQIQCEGTPLEVFDNVVYAQRTLTDGSTYLLRMNISVPQTGADAPVVVYVPGGGFIVASRDNSLGNRAYLLDAGVAVASIEYRTIGDGATYRDGIADVKSAVRFLRAHADEYGLDTDSIGLWGESAGAYLSTMAGVTNGEAEFEVGENLEQSSDVQAVVEEFGASDLVQIAADFDQETQDYYTTPDNFVASYVLGVGTGKTLRDDPVAAAAADPVTHIDGSEPPFLHFHGSEDTLISPSQTLLIHNALQAAAVDSTRYLVTGAGHGDLGFLSNPEGAKVWTSVAIMDPIVEFFLAQLS